MSLDFGPDYDVDERLLVVQVFQICEILFVFELPALFC